MPSVTTSILPVWQLRGVCFWAWKPWGRLHIWKKFLKGFRCIPSHAYHFHSYFRCTNKRISTSESWHLRIIWKIMRFSIVPSYGAVVGEMYTCHQLIKIYIYIHIFKDTWYTFRYPPKSPVTNISGQSIIRFPSLANFGCDIPKLGIPKKWFEETAWFPERGTLLYKLVLYKWV